MPSKKPKIRTLPDGYKIHHHEPDEKFPEGKKVLLSGQSRLRERLEAAREDNEAAHQVIHDQRRDALVAKQDAEKASPTVPCDKRVV